MHRSRHRGLIQPGPTNCRRPPQTTAPPRRPLRASSTFAPLLSSPLRSPASLPLRRSHLGVGNSASSSSYSMRRRSDGRTATCLASPPSFLPSLSVTRLSASWERKAAMAAATPNPVCVGRRRGRQCRRRRRSQRLCLDTSSPSAATATASLSSATLLRFYAKLR